MLSVGGAAGVRDGSLKAQWVLALMLVMVEGVVRSINQFGGWMPGGGELTLIGGWGFI